SPPPRLFLLQVFEGVYNNARMLHFLTAVVGSTCDVRVKNGSVYEGIFKTLSSRCELAVDAVHKVKSEDGDGGGGGAPPRIEEITDTMIFSPNDLITMTCRDVDLNFATRDTFTDSAISSSRVNGEHREKVLQRWDGGDSNGENFDLEADASNGWDASEMFRYNEENYGVKSTYDSSLSMYTVPLERGNTEGYRQREARAARLASEIESSPQYRHRVALENDEGRTEEEKFSSVMRDREREERERGRDSPSFSNPGSREGKYIPLPQRAREREMSSRGERDRVGPQSSLPNRAGRPGSQSSSPRPSLPSGGCQPSPSTDRSSPLSVRGVYSSSPSQSSLPTQTPAEIAPNSPPILPHSLSHPQSLSEARPVNGGELCVSNSHTYTFSFSGSVPHVLLCFSTVSSRTSPKSQRPVQANRPIRTNSHSSPTGTDRHHNLSLIIHVVRCLSPPPSTCFSPCFFSCLSHPVSRSPKPDAPSQDPPLVSPGYLDTSSVSMVTLKNVQMVWLSESEMRLVPFLTVHAGSATHFTLSVRLSLSQVKKSTLNPNAKEFNPTKAPLNLAKPSSTPTPPRPTPPSPVVLPPPPGQGTMYNAQYLPYVSPIQIQSHSVQAPQIYPYAMSTVNQGKYPRSKGAVVPPRPDHSSSAPPMLQPTQSAAGPPLVASPYSQSYLQYGQVIPAMTHYPGQPVYSMLQSGARMLSSGGHPQTLGPPGPQYPGQTEGPPVPQQGMYAPQSFSHHSGAMHPPQPSSTPTGSQPPPQHPAPSPGQVTSSVSLMAALLLILFRALLGARNVLSLILLLTN
uniref:LsmAD domain-containing protein n=1 Tax=Denticeps clupeoides TaxID=299321 RepID=A0AAY4EV14_9TELE